MGGGGGDHVALWENLWPNSKGNCSYPNLSMHSNSSGLELEADTLAHLLTPVGKRRDGKGV